MTDVVCVLAGKWKCLGDGQWKFVIDKGQMARAVTLTENMSYGELMDVIEDIFKIGVKTQMIDLSFWCPEISNFCTQTRLPPVTIGCDSELRQFRNKLALNDGLNIFMSIREEAEEDGGNGCFDPKTGDNHSEDGDQDQTMFVTPKNTRGKDACEKGESSRASSRREGRGRPTLPSSSASRSSFTPIDDSDDAPTPGAIVLAGEELMPLDAASDGDNNMFEDPPSEERMTVNGEDAIYVESVFKTKQVLQAALSMHAIKNQFCYRLEKSDRTRIIARCVDTECDWRVYATRHKDSDQFEIRTATLQHKCGIASRSRFGEKATAKVLGQVLKSQYENGKKGPRPCEIPTIVQAQFNVRISYMKAYYAQMAAKHAALGSEEDSYNNLTTYLHLLTEANPGTISDLHTVTTQTGEKQFKYLFVALGASVKGASLLRKVVVIDGTQLKGKYKGCLVTASGQDGNMQIFPLAFGVVDSENEDSWGWFLDNLQTFVEDDADLIFVSDRHAAITAALSVVYPKAHHGACYVHLWRNVKANFKSSELAGLMSKAARAYTLGEFRFFWAEIEKRSPSCAQYLQRIGFDHWTLSHSPVNRYNLMTSNISESLNAAMMKAVNLPIAAMLEVLREMIMSWFATRRDKALRSAKVCTPNIEDKLVSQLTASSACQVVSASSGIFQVSEPNSHTFVVDLKKKSCSCKVFDVMQFPCCHAIASAKSVGMDIYDLVSAHYSTATWKMLYDNIIMPLNRIEDSPNPEVIPSIPMLPPSTRRPAGRPRTARIPSRGEGFFNKMFATSPRPAKCGRCGRTGHNKGTCKNPI